MKLLDLQKKFAWYAAKLIAQAFTMGYGVTLGETWRPPEMAKIYAKQGKGTANSLHCVRLAIDLNLFRGKDYLINLEDYRPLGEWWKSIGTEDFPTRWGGDFHSGDANHFSVEYEGKK